MFNSSSQLASQSDRCLNSTKLFYPLRHKEKKDKRKNYVLLMINSPPLSIFFGKIDYCCQILSLQIINLPNPYVTNCTKRSLAVFNSNSYTSYTKAACLLNCRNEYTIKTCACTPVEFKGMNHLTLTEL